MECASAIRAGRGWRVAAMTAALTLLVGCGSLPVAEEVPEFRAGAGNANQQLNSAFADINTFLRERQIERAIRQPSLNEGLFVQGLADSDIARWNRAFAAIDAYAAGLEKLLDPKQRSDAQTELSGLGDAISALDGKQLPDGVAAGFAQFGGLLLQVKNQKDAMSAIRIADPGIQGVLAQMADAIGGDANQGIRGTVRSNWRDVLGEIQIDFLAAKPQGESALRAVVQRYLDNIGQRDAQDALLASLRHSLILLAAAHSELAAGRRAGSREVLTLALSEYKSYRAQLDALRRKRAGDTSTSTQGAQP
jgi:hypothetical protein